MSTNANKSGTYDLPDVVTNKDAVSHIDFEWQMPYNERLVSKQVFQEAIAQTMSDILSKTPFSLSLSPSDIAIPELELRPNSTTPQRIKIRGWFSCKDTHRKTYQDALKLSHQSRKLSKLIAEKAKVKRNKVSIQQFDSRYTSAKYIDMSTLRDTKANYNQYLTTVSKTLTTVKSDPDLSNDNKDNDNDNKNDDNDNKQSDNSSYSLVTDLVIDKNIPSSNLDTNSSVIIHNDYDTDDDAFTNSASGDGSSNDNKVDSSGGGGDDYHHIIPRVTSIHDIVADIVATPTPDDDIVSSDDELDKLRSQLKRAKTELSTMATTHRDQVSDLEKKISTIKKEEKIRGLSLQIDDDIIRKKVLLDKADADKVYELEEELSAKDKSIAVEMSTMTAKHTTEMNFLKKQLKKKNQSHNLELSNIRENHKTEITQMKQQIRALTGSLQRESVKDRQINELREENEELKSSKNDIISNYENALAKLKEDDEKYLQNEINLWGRQRSKLQREIIDLKQQIKRCQTQINTLNNDINNSQNENLSNQQLIDNLSNSLDRERQKSHKYVQKIKFYEQYKQIKPHKDGGGTSKKAHKRVPSGLKGRQITIKNLDAGGKEIIVEPKKGLKDIAALLDDDQDPVVSTDDDYDDFDDDQILDDDAQIKFIEESEHIQQIKLKDQAISSLKDKIKSLEESITSLKKINMEEINNLQQQIGSLREKQTIEHENFLKQKQMLEYKLQRETNDKKNNTQKLSDLTYTHKKEIRSLNDEIIKLQNKITDKNATIQSLEEHLEMLVADNQRLKEIEEDWLDQQDYLDEEDQELLDRQAELDDLHMEKDRIAAELHNIQGVLAEKDQQVKKRESTIITLELELKKLHDDEKLINDKKNDVIKLQQLITDKKLIKKAATAAATTAAAAAAIVATATATPKSPPIAIIPSKKRHSIQLDDPNDNSSDTNSDNSDDQQYQLQFKGAGQADLDPPDNDDDDIDDPITPLPPANNSKIIDDMNYKHALQIDTMSQRHNQELMSLQNDQNILKKQINDLFQKNNDLNNKINSIQNQLKNEKLEKEQIIKSKELLLKNFVKEFDRMRNEIKKQNTKKNNRYKS